MTEPSAFSVTRQQVHVAVEDGLGVLASVTGDEDAMSSLRVTADYEAAADAAINIIIAAARTYAAGMSPAHATALDEILVSMGAELPE
jgi:hypothetical protein